MIVNIMWILVVAVVFAVIATKKLQMGRNAFSTSHFIGYFLSG